MRLVNNLSYLLWLAVMAFVGFYFEQLSQGLATPTGQGPFFCHELMSSGGDDEVMIASFRLFVIPLGVRLLRIRGPLTRYEIGLFYICAALVCAALALASMDCAFIFYTAFVLPDVSLALALMGLPAAWFALARIRPRARLHEPHA